MADLARIKRNVAKMAAQNAPIEDIDGYIASEGATVDAVRDFNDPGGAPPQSRGRHLSFEEGQARLDTEGAIGGVGAALTATADGVPIAGPALLGGTQRAAAGLSSLINGRSYDENLGQAQNLTAAAQEQHPYLTTTGNIAGAVGGTIPLVMAAPAAFGAGAGNLALRSGAAMLSGGALGAGDAAVRSGGDTEEILRGMKWGGGLGLAGPAVGRVVGTGVQKVFNALRDRGLAAAAGTSRGALESVEQAMRRDGIDSAALRARLDALGPEGMIADLGPNLQGQAAAIANMPGRGQEIVRSALDGRHAGANTRLASAIDNSMGPAVVPSSIKSDIAAAQHAVAPMYEEAFRNARAVDTAPVANLLESRAVTLRGDARQAVQRIRSMLDITGTDVLDPNPGTLFQTRQAIDGMMATETNPQAIRAMTEARGQIDELLGRSVPGIKDADAVYAELARQREALQRGQSVLSHGREAPRPSELDVETRQGALPQGTQIGPSAVPLRLSQGARAEVDRILGSNANDVAALNRIIKTEGDWNRSRLTSLFGRERAEQLFQALDNELTFAATRDFATGNRAHAGRQQAMRELGGADGGLGARDVYAAGGAVGVARQAGVRAIDKVFSALVERQRLSRSASLGDIITSNRKAVADAIAAREIRPVYSPAVEAVAKSILLGGGTTRAR